MDLLTKFDTVKVLAGNRITDDDRDYCIAHQNAYDSARSCFLELIYIWEDLADRQRNFLAGLETSSSGTDCYLPDYDTDLKISTPKIEEHIIRLHTRFIHRLSQHFNQKYHVSVDAAAIAEHLLPEKPAGGCRTAVEEANQYQENMLSLGLRYEDILDEIFAQLDGRDFREQALFELKEKCHKAAWNNYNKTPKYEVKKNVLRFSSYGCSYDDSFRGERWNLQEHLKQVFHGIAHYETGSFSAVPSGFSSLLGYNHSGSDLVLFPGCVKIQQLKMFKNGRVDIRFSSEESARTFVKEYLGLVY